jgi:hypothetical protein
MNKPDILYHASENNHLIQLDPRTDEERLAHYGTSLLFATPYKPMAAMFLAPKTQDNEITRFGHIFAFIAATTSEEFIQKDLGGAIYTLPSDSFSTNTDLNMPDTEFVAKESVKPIEKDVYTSALAAMKDNNVNVYFVDDSTLNAIRLADDHGLKIIQSLVPYS